MRSASENLESSLQSFHNVMNRYVTSDSSNRDTRARGTEFYQDPGWIFREAMEAAEQVKAHNPKNYQELLLKELVKACPHGPQIWQNFVTDLQKKPEFAALRDLIPKISTLVGHIQDEISDHEIDNMLGSENNS